MIGVIVGVQGGGVAPTYVAAPGMMMSDGSLVRKGLCMWVRDIVRALWRGAGLGWTGHSLRSPESHSVSENHMSGVEIDRTIG